MHVLWLWFRLYLGLRTYFSFPIDGNFVVGAQTKTLDLIRPKYWKKKKKNSKRGTEIKVQSIKFLKQIPKVTQVLIDFSDNNSRCLA